MADRYWICKTTGNWSDTDNWSDAYNGSTGKSVPTIGDIAFMSLQLHDEGGDYPICVFDVDVECDGIDESYSEGDTPLVRIDFNGKNATFAVHGVYLTTSTVESLVITDAYITTCVWNINDNLMIVITTGSTIELTLVETGTVESYFGGFFNDESETIYNDLILNYSSGGIESSYIFGIRFPVDVTFNTISSIAANDTDGELYVGDINGTAGFTLYCNSWEATGSIADGFTLYVESMDYFSGGGS